MATPAFIDLEARVYGPQRIVAMVAVLAEDGVAAADALSGTGLDPVALNDPGTQVSYAQNIAVIRNALRLAPNSAIALRAGARMHVTAYGMWGYALLSSRSFTDIIDIAIKYRGLIGPLASMDYSAERGPGFLQFQSAISADPDDPMYRFAIEFTYAAHVTLGGDLYGDAVRFERASVVYPAPPYAHAYSEWLQCPVQFGQQANEAVVPARWLEQAPRMHNTYAYLTARRICEQSLQALKQAEGVAGVVRRTLLGQMPWRFPTIATMARELAMPARTLRRRLQAEGTSYRAVLTEVRLNLATGYLRQTRLTTEEIAERLGYSDAANFRHAFKRWTGNAPNTFRNEG